MASIEAGDTIISEDARLQLRFGTAEEAVVGKTSRVVEEVVIGKESSTREGKAAFLPPPPPLKVDKKQAAQPNIARLPNKVKSLCRTRCYVR